MVDYFIAVLAQPFHQGQQTMLQHSSQNTIGNHHASSRRSRFASGPSAPPVASRRCASQVCQCILRSLGKGKAENRGSCSISSVTASQSMSRSPVERASKGCG